MSSRSLVCWRKKSGFHLFVGWFSLEMLFTSTYIHLLLVLCVDLFFFCSFSSSTQPNWIHFPKQNIHSSTCNHIFFVRLLLFSFWLTFCLFFYHISIWMCSAKMVFSHHHNMSPCLTLSIFTSLPVLSLPVLMLLYWLMVMLLYG